LKHRTVITHGAGVVLLALVPGSAAAHAAFGDLGPFYQGLLHPFADPAQGLLLAACAAALARQPLDTVRPAYAALVIAGFVTLIAGLILPLPVPGLRAIALLALVVAIAALSPVRPPPLIVAAIALPAGFAAALPLDLGTGSRTLMLGLAGGAAGIALVTLFLWGAADWASRRISPVAGLVIPAWIAAICLMTAALPA
jgi:urease accessory protein